MAFFNPKNPAPYLEDLIDRYKTLIDQINRGKMIGELERLRLQMICIYHRQVRQLFNPVGKKFLMGKLTICQYNFF